METPAKKVCTVCSKEKLLKEFPRRLSARCLACRAEHRRTRDRAYRKALRDKTRTKLWEAIPKTRCCTKCSTEKSLDEFSDRPEGKWGKESRCQTCMQEYHVAYDAENKKKIYTRQVTYRQTNAARLKVRDKAYREGLTEEYR